MPGSDSQRMPPVVRSISSAASRLRRSWLLEVDVAPEHRSHAFLDLLVQRQPGPEDEARLRQDERRLAIQKREPLQLLATHVVAIVRNELLDGGVVAAHRPLGEVRSGRIAQVLGRDRPQDEGRVGRFDERKEARRVRQRRGRSTASVASEMHSSPP